MAETKAHAKVNLLLSVRPGAAPDGYHAVETVLCALGIADDVSVEPADEAGIALACDPDPLGGRPAEGNLAYRAAAAACAAFGVEPRLRIRVAKRVPSQAGLGGGSSDAGAVLRCLAGLWGVEPSDGRLERVAASLGADVPFFLDERPGRYAGRGDVLVERFAPFALPVVLVKPPVGVSTGEAYRALDRLAPAELDAAPLLGALRAGDAGSVPLLCGNNMESAARAVAPALGAVFSLLEGVQGTVGRPLLCGSGSCVAAFAEDEGAAEEVARRARGAGWWACATSTLA